ncbi:MAG: type I-U CRISPR-associated RAMP protein Csb1/Cas7u [Phycisphaerales bacterium JB039]
MSAALTTHDSWLTSEGAAAIVRREHLMPVEGRDGVIFPATFAAGDGFPGGYNIDPSPEAEENVCLIDSVGSQANRIEPIFATDPCAALVPQVTIKVGDKLVALLEAGHRAGDAVVRCTELQKELRGAFRALQAGDAAPLAKLAPTSLLFGVWDSRDTQAKAPRLIASTIRAYNVRRLTRGAQFVPAVDYVAAGALPEPTDRATRDKYAERGFTHVPSSATHGGVIATGGIRRDATLSLAALRLLRAGADEEGTLALRRYILGLALVAFTARPTTYLRQGCNLVPDPDKQSEFVEVRSDGARAALNLTHDAALEYAAAAAAAFGVGENWEVQFDRQLDPTDGADGKPAKRSKKAKA